MGESLDRSRAFAPYVLMMALFAVVLAGTVYVMRRPEPAAIAITTATPRPTPSAVLVVVDIRGAVIKPGVYSLSAGSRLQEALTLAGGTVADADLRGLNLARKLVDGEQIYVPVQGEGTGAFPTVSASRVPAAVPQGKININAATVEQLDTLPGIGPALAQRIVEYRTVNGPFTTLEDLKKVRGIGDVIFAQMQDLISLD
jgi:competence protein ComEA